jgi:hypothetical protein
LRSATGCAISVIVVFLLARLALISASGIRLGTAEPRSASFFEMIHKLSPLTKAIDRFQASLAVSRNIKATYEAAAAAPAPASSYLLTTYRSTSLAR